MTPQHHPPRRPPPQHRRVALARAFVLAWALLWAAPGAWAQDRAEVDRTPILGARELPKVLYIVPWKKPPPGGLSGRPVASVLDEALAPVERDVLRRQIQYEQQLQAQAPAPGTVPNTIPNTAPSRSNPAPAATPEKSR